MGMMIRITDQHRCGAPKIVLARKVISTGSEVLEISLVQGFFFSHQRSILLACNLSASDTLLCVTHRYTRPRGSSTIDCSAMVAPYLLQLRAADCGIELGCRRLLICRVFINRLTASSQLFVSLLVASVQHKVNHKRPSKPKTNRQQTVAGALPVWFLVPTVCQ